MHRPSVVGMCVFLVLGMGQVSGIAGEPTDKTPAVTLQPLPSAEFDELLKSHRGEVVFVDFRATWCVPCVQQFPKTVELHRQFGKDGLTVISISLDEPDSRDDVLAFLKKHEAGFENRICKEGLDQKAFEAFDIENGALPHYKIYDRTGRLVKTFNSGDPENSIKHAEIERTLRETLEAK
ncbi:MAG: TlpA family protein disulfide reductase [Planctomycetaceae bacterium]